MLISAREACRILGETGVSKRCALQVLSSGLAGEAVRGGAVALYDDARVLDLARRRRIPALDVEQLCPRGFFISRRAFPAAASREIQLAALTRGWGAVSPWRWIAVTSHIGSCGSFPFMATVGGLMVLGADIVGVRGGSELVLQRPGAWFEAMNGRWFPTGPGRPWVLQLGPLAPEKIAG